MPEANPRSQHACISRRGGINSYLRGRGSRSKRGRVCARAPRSRSVPPFNVTDTFPRSLRHPTPSPRHSRLAQPRAGSAPPPPGPPSLRRAPINQRSRCQSSGGSAPADRGHCHYSSGRGPRRSLPGLCGCKQSAVSFRGGRAEEGSGRRRGPGPRARLRAAGQESPAAATNPSTPSSSNSVPSVFLRT